MSMDETAKRILEEVGGENNIDNLIHCVTRLRFTLKSLDNVDEGRIKAIPGVLGVVNQGGQLQVIIGQQVEEAYKAIIKIADIKTSAPVVADEGDDKGEKQGVVSRVLDAIAGIFTPIMPVIAGAGMIKALLSILKLFSLIDPDGTLYYFLSFIADAAYFFLPIYLAAASAKKFHCNMYMSMLLGAMLLHPNFSALGDTGTVVSVIGLPVRIVTYSSSVIPILMIVFAFPMWSALWQKSFRQQSSLSPSLCCRCLSWHLSHFACWARSGRFWVMHLWTRCSLSKIWLRGRFPPSSVRSCPISL